ncbi:DNA polymerase III subunit delta' [Canibacter sp. lx-45]|uniref:DNA polymerase III subunit delta' n=1 Tax=Canibacter zhuwentaonis TaxID=2837491 RepID=UPI001BDCE839|nr:DNA polymerase III subunit delta' [Canibacter zhuwentaonis]MBT1035903.1 DNA polymerase III subunit delta' [Canibacter zhuwentaonis]
MDFWSELVGQEGAVATLQSAADPKNSADLAHAWLITGPPGSGRYNAATLFAAALIHNANSDVSRETLRGQIVSGNHPDVTLVRTYTSGINVSEMRKVAAEAYYLPTTANKKIIIIEDADRMNAYAANSLLKALEEPPATTVWILCAPAESDLLPTIRSRTRLVRLVTPDPAKTAALLSAHSGIDADLAARVARLAQGHIGMARALAQKPELLQLREDTITEVLRIQSPSDAMTVAAKLHSAATEHGEAQVDERIIRKKNEIKHAYGLAPNDPVPRELSGELTKIEAMRKTWLTRANIDAVDRVLLDLLTLCRDLFTVQLKTGAPLINSAQEQRITALGAALTPAQIATFMTALEKARIHITRNVRSRDALEAALISLLTI